MNEIRGWSIRKAEVLGKKKNSFTATLSTTCPVDWPRSGYGPAR